MTDFYPLIQYKIVKSIGSVASEPDPSQWIVPISAAIFVSTEFEDEVYAGSGMFYFIDVEASSDVSNYDPQSLLDIESETSHFICLFDDSGYFSDEVEDMLQIDPFVRNMFIVDRVEIIHRFRGNGLAGLVVNDAIDMFKKTANVVGLKAYPLQMEPRHPINARNDHDTLMALNKFTCTDEEASRKLGLFYEGLGFKFIGNEGLMIRSC